MIRRALRWLAIGAGVLLLVGATLTGVLSGPVSGDNPPLWLAIAVGLFVAGLVFWKLLWTPTDDDVTAPPWAEGGEIVEGTPEATPETVPISGTELAEIVELAATQARKSETIEDGLERVRPPLREALVATLIQGGWSEERIHDALAAGSWTDDQVAASVLDESVQSPARSLRRRIWAWLFPEKAVRHRTGRAVGALASVAGTVLPPVVGQDAPRPMPVLEPTLEDLQRASDGSLRRAVDGRASIAAAQYDRSGPDTDEAGETRSADDHGSDDPTTSDADTDGEQPADDSAARTASDADGWATAGGDD